MDGKADDNGRMTLSAGAIAVFQVGKRKFAKALFRVFWFKIPFTVWFKMLKKVVKRTKERLRGALCLSLFHPIPRLRRCVGLMLGDITSVGAKCCPPLHFHASCAELTCHCLAFCFRK